MWQEQWQFVALELQHIHSLPLTQLGIMEAPLHVEVAKKMELTSLQFQSRATVSSQEGQATAISWWPQLHIAEANFLASVAGRSVAPFLSPAPLSWLAENSEALMIQILACS